MHALQLLLAASIIGSSINLTLALDPSATSSSTDAVRLAAAAQRAEALYQGSSDAANTTALPSTTDLTLKPTPAVTTTQPRPTAKTAQTTSTPSILGRYKKFSETWWGELRKCHRCPPRDERIDCPKLLKENPAWLEVAKMPSRTKFLIMDNFLAEHNHYASVGDSLCNLACAVCAGTDPDQRHDGSISASSTHTPLHLAAFARHFGFFSLLLAKGALPNRRCQPAHPCNFVDDESWRAELAKYGEKCTDYR